MTTNEQREWIFYDGGCGVCHWAVAFVAERDAGQHFRFAPLFGETFGRLIPDAGSRDLPDSLIVYDRDGRLQLRSNGVVHILHRLGGGWGKLSRLLRLVPRPLRDLAYDLFARIRHRFVSPPDGVCPLMPPDLARRFDP